MYLFLIIILLLLAFFVYKKFDEDILSPSVISLLMFSFCTFFAWLGTFSWNTEKLSFFTIFIIVSGLISFVFGEYVVRKKYNNSKVNNIKSIKIIKIENYKFYLTIFGILLTITLLILEIKRICNYYDFYSNNLGELLSFYRTKIGLFSTDLAKDNIDINFIVKQFKKICDVLLVIYMYIVVNNIFAKDKLKRILIYSIPIILCLFVTLLNSGRSIMMHMIVALFMLIFIIYRNKNSNDKKISRKIFGYSFLAIGLSLIIFCVVLPIVGRSMGSNIYDYLTFYIGTSIPSLNRFLANVPIHGPYIGNETFSGIYYVLNKLNIIEYLKAGSLEWTYFGSDASNVYTSFRRYFFDFGYIGVIILQFLFGYLMSMFYLKVKNNNNNKYFLIIYVFFAYVLIDQIRDEQFFTLISSATLAYLLLIVFFVWFFMDFNTKKFLEDIKKVLHSANKVTRKNK